MRLLTALFLLATATVARASPGDTYGVFARGLSTVGSQTAAADDVGAAYYNPAGLAIAGEAGKTAVTLGYAMGLPFPSLERTKPEANSQFKTHLPENTGWATVGLLFPFRGIVKNRASLGILAYLPTSKLAKVESLEVRDPQWLRYQNATDRILLEVGLGVKLHPRFALGLGVDVLAGLQGTVNFDVELFEKRVDRRDLSFELQNSVALVAGMTLTPVDSLRIGLSYRMANQLALSQPNDIALGDLGTLKLNVSGILHYTPHTLAAGITYMPNPRVKLSADLRVELWENAPFPAVNVAVSLGGEIPSQLGLDRALAFETNDPEAGFKRTFTPSLAFEYTFPDEVTRLRGGYAFRPTYVPNQVQPTSNALDNDAHLIGLGATFQITDPTEVFSQPIKLDLGVQGQLFATRTVVKSQPNDPVGNYAFGGFAIAFVSAVRYEF